MASLHRAVARTTLLILALIGSTPGAVLAAADDAASLRHYVRQTWQTAEGLPQNSVRAIAQTPDGYLWFGTAEGLVRFDGVRMTVYDRTSNPALPGKNVDSLAVAPDGSLWIGLRRQGVARLSGDVLTTWTTAQGLSGNDVLSLVAAPDGTIWVGTSGDGLSRIRGAGVAIYRREQGLPDNFVYALALTSRGEIIAGTGAGAVLVSDRGVEPLTAAARAPLAVGAVVEGHDGDLWIGATTGLLRVHGGAVTTYGVADGLPSPDVVALARGADRTMWVGMRSGGFARFRDGRFETFTAADGLPDDFIHAIFEDRERNLWVGAAAGGVSRLRPTPFLTVSKRDGLPADVIRAVHEGRDGSLWAGTHAYGLIRFHDGRTTRWTTADGLPSDGVSMIGESRDGAMWIGTRDGLVRMQGRRMTAFGAANGLPSLNVRGFFEDRDGQVWIATVAGVCRIDGARCTAVAGLDFYVRGFHQSPDGALWMATTRGLVCYRDGVVTRWGKREGLSSEFLTSLTADADGTLWMSSGGGGLMRFSAGRVTSVRAAQGLHDDNIFRVLSDGRGWVWMTSNRGLFRASRDELVAVGEGRARAVRSHVYTEVDGLPSSEFNGGSFPAGVIARNGRLWLPSVKGVVIVDPTRFPGPSEPPAVHLERVMANGRPVATRSASVGPGKGDLEFQYTAFRYAAPTRLRFRYRLEGFDTDWIDAGVRRTAFYTNLPPGDYTFHAQASFGDGNWGRSSTTFPITIRPRFYQTNLFLVGSIFVGLAIVLGALRLRTVRQRALERRLRAMVDERTRELQEEVAERKRTERALVEAREAAIEASRLKSEFLANMSHEIRTPMNGVIGMTDLALDHELETPVREYLQTVRSSADSLLHVINDILDFAKIEAGKLELADADFDPRELVTEVVRLLGTRARDKGLQFECVLPEELPVRVVGDPLRLRQVLTNLIGNALKFTEQGEVRVELSLAAADKTPDAVGIRFAVVDSGIGIAERDVARIFDAFTQADGSSTRRFGGTGLGLSISSQLVRLMGGRLEVTSVLGQGSTFSFAIDFRRGMVGPAASERVASAPAPVATPMRPLVALVAEDNPVNQLVTARLLERAGHRVTIVESGAAAIAALASATFDIVLMDVQMPEMNGFEATRRIRDGEAGADAASVPIIALTAHAMRGDRERCLEAGMDGYVSKPLRAPELYAALEHALDARDAA